MINGIGSTGGSGRIEGTRPAGAARAGAARPETLPASVADDEAPASPASEMAALGPPVTIAKVDDLRARIAAGTYRVDPQAVAAKMIALDLPEKQ